MEAARAKALVRSRIKEAAQQREKRIDSPLVRYNDLGQPVCKVCNIQVKSESLWPAHLVSRQHKEAAEDLKARAKSAGISAGKPPPPPADPTHADARLAAPAAVVPAVRSSSALPADFFDSTEPKKIRSEDTETGGRPPRDVKGASSRQGGGKKGKKQNGNAQAEASCALPEGFFDSVDADHKARGLEPPKVDLNDEWKEFQKSIQDDVKEVENRLDEEEFQAAEEREERELFVQRSLQEKVEAFRKKQQEKAAALAAAAKIPEAQQDEEEVSSDEESEEDNYYVDWRAKHL